jgi:hypothetical protein
MRRLADKGLIAIICCSILWTVRPMDVAGVVCLLVAVTSGASFEYVRGTARFLGPAALLVIAFALPDVGCATLPVAAYDLATTGDERGDMPLTALWAIRLA